MVKTIFDAQDRRAARRAHGPAPKVTELIEGFVVAMNLETTEQGADAHHLPATPTLSEMMKESVLNAYGQALNI